MTDTPRKSQRLKLKDRDKQSLNRTLKIKLSKQSEDDEDMSVLQVKQNATTREIEHFDMRRYRRKRSSSNNFLKVHNSYCTSDRTSKYDGYDSKFIHDSDSTSCSSDGEIDKDLDGEKITKPKRFVVSSSSDNEVGEGLYELYGGAVDINDRELVERSTSKDLERGQLGDRSNHLSDEDLISPARKLKMSVLSSDGSDSEPSHGSQSTPRTRKRSTRAMKVQARMKSDREKQFENFRAKRNRNECGKVECKPITSVPNLGDICRLIDEENELLPSACQGLSKFSCKELFGYSKDSPSEEEDVCPIQLSPHYLEAIRHTKFIVDSQSDDHDSECVTSLQQPTVYEFSDRATEATANIVLDSDDGVELAKLVDSEDELSPNVFLSTLNEYQDFDPDSTTDEVRNIIAITDPTLERVCDERDIQEDEKMLLADRFDLEFSPVDEGVKVKTLQDEVVSSFTDRAGEISTPVTHKGPTDSDNSDLDENPFVIDYYI